MTLPEVAALAAIVLIWGINNAAAMVATDVLPPLLVAALRFAIAAIVLAPFLRPPFPNPKTLMVLVLLGGPIHFGLIYVGYWLAEDLSPFVVAQQMWIPFTALVAFLLLGERLKRLAVAGLVVAFAGVAWMTADPRALRDVLPILLGLVGALAWAVQKREAGRVTPYLLATPLVSAVIGVLFLGDVLTPQIIAGAAVAMAGVVLVALAERGLRVGAAKT